MSTSSLFFPWAKQPDIIRATQKDDCYLRVLYDQFQDVFNYLLGPQRCMVYANEIKLIADMSYFGANSILDKPTLGEEYGGLVQVLSTHQTPVNLARRLWHFFLLLLMPYGVGKLYNKYVHYNWSHLISQRQDHFNSPHAITSRMESNQDELSKVPFQGRKKIANALSLAKVFIDTIQRIHIAIFYIKGGYYQVAKRLARITHILNRNLDETRFEYHVLGYLILVQLVIALSLKLRLLLTRCHPNLLEKEMTKTQDGHHHWLQSNGKCSLCLGIRKATTSTSCGHMFCWTCIVEWCQNKPECPLCRTPQKMNELLLVLNYL